jgi:hypothetical protein
LASVTALLTASPPDDAENVTVTPGRKLLLASRTNAVMVAFEEPLDGICGRLVIADMAATVDEVPLLLVELELANELGLSPPQPLAAPSAASTRTHPN